MMKINLAYFFLAFMFFSGSCKNNPDPDRISDTRSKNLFLDYKITGEEGFDKLTVLARVRYGGKNGNGLLLEKPSKIELDSEVFPVDSAAMSGIFYELNKPIESFTGNHSIVFTDFSRKKFKEEFSFEPLILLNDFSETVKRKNLQLDFGEAKDGQLVRVLLTDTSFTGDGLNRIDTIRNNRLTITQHDLSALHNGPIQLELIKINEGPVVNDTGGGGTLKIHYTIRREFILED